MLPSYEQLANRLTRNSDNREEYESLFTPSTPTLKSAEEISKYRRMNPGSIWADDEEISRRIA